jgi:NitT/TauT family transport system permease protein
VKKLLASKSTRILRGGAWSLLPLRTWPHIIDLIIFAAGLALFYGLITVARTWVGPVTPTVEIDRSPWALPAYAGYSLLRILIAYLLSLAFTLVYGYIAAYNATAERFMIPLLDILQSIPVLSFLPYFRNVNWGSSSARFCSFLPARSGTWRSAFMLR